MIKKILHRLLDIHPDAMSFQNSMDLADAPVVTLYQGDKKINFILDTGATCCTIDSQYLNNLEHEKLDTVVNNRGIEGITTQCKTCSIKVSYKNKHYKIPCLIQDLSKTLSELKQETGVTIHGILGTNFFNAFNYVLDFEKYIAYSKE